MTYRDRFEAVYDAYYPAIHQYAARRTGSPEDAADVISETFLTAWRRIGDVPEGEDALLWLYGVARRVLANQQRANPAGPCSLSGYVRNWQPTGRSDRSNWTMFAPPSTGYPNVTARSWHWPAGRA